MKKHIMLLAALALLSGCALQTPQSTKSNTPQKSCDCMKDIKKMQEKHSCGMKNMPKDANHMNHNSHEGCSHKH